MSMRRKLRKIIYGIMALAGTGAVLYMLWRGGAFLPGWITWENETLQDADQQYEIVLAHRKVQVWQNDHVIWTSPKRLKVQQAQVNDIDNDGQDELILLCWRIGKYGRSRPFWVEHNEQRWSQHIAVYECNGEKVKTKWMASDIGFEVCEIWAGERAEYVRKAVRKKEDKPAYAGVPEETAAMQESAGSIEEAGKTEDPETENKETERAVEQKEYRVRPNNRLLLTDRNGHITCWFWDSWGFTREATEVSFCAFGDNLIHEPIYQYGLHNDENFSFLYENVKDMIAKSDISVINQETPLTDDPARYGGYPQFGTPVQVGESISDAGFDVVTCATNHALDQGMTGVDFTKRFFNDTGVICLGIQGADEIEYRPYDIIVRNGIRTAMLNYTYGTNGIQIPAQNPNAVHLLEDEEQIRTDISMAKEESDIVAVFVHWGTEYAEEPDTLQKKWTQIFLECGVDVTVGTHPHVLQPCELLRDDSGHEMLVYYSIGNYISAQAEKSCVRGGMAEFTVALTAEGYRIREYGLRPLVITWQGKKCMVDPGSLPNITKD